MAALLISHGADVNLRCANERTALHEAAKLGRQDMVKLMLVSGAHPDPQSSYGFTPLALAAQSGQTEIMEMLLQKGKIFISFFFFFNNHIASLVAHILFYFLNFLLLSLSFIQV